MLDVFTNRLGGRVALFVNIFLAFMVLVGIGYVHARLSASIDEQLVEKGKILSVVGAESVSRIMEEALDNSALSLTDVFDVQYKEIPGTNPPKYHTRYDAYLDKAILKLQDEFLEDASVLYAVSIDINGYLPTHNTRYQQPLTGDEIKDLSGNRTKRIYRDDAAARAAVNRNKGFVQTYEDEVGQIIVEVSSPIFVKGRHWGGFRMGLKPLVTSDSKMDLLKSLVLGGIVFLLFSGGAIFYIVNRSLKPLVEFSKMATDLADGDVDQVIEFDRKDEIGKVAEALERLRISLQAAIERLMRR
jgi:methyl-accepting chemotaxis protein